MYTKQPKKAKKKIRNTKAEIKMLGLNPLTANLRLTAPDERPELTVFASQLGH